MQKVLDAEKIRGYDKLFQQWKAELFPHEEYKYANQVCFAFAHKLAKKAKEEGFLPIKAWCLQSQNDEAVVARFPAATAEGFIERRWQGFHVAMAIDLPIYKDSNKTERVIFDPVLFNQPVRLADWQRALNSSEEYICFSAAKFGAEAKADTSFYGGSGYWLDKDPPLNLDTHAKAMLRGINTETEKLTLLNSPLMRLANVSERQISRSQGVER